MLTRHVVLESYEGKIAGRRTPPRLGCELHEFAHKGGPGPAGEAAKV